MGQYRCKIVILILFLTLSCNQKTTTTVETVPKRKQNHWFIEPWFACLTKRKLNNTTLITVHDDPVYHSTKGKKRLLLHLLETHTAIKNLDAEKYQIVFECIDGYKPMMPLQNFFRSNHFLPSGYGCTKGNYGQNH
jgi:hypothetical protein